MLAGTDDHLTLPYLITRNSKFRKYGFHPFRIRDTGATPRHVETQTMQIACYFVFTCTLNFLVKLLL